MTLNYTYPQTLPWCQGSGRENSYFIVDETYQHIIGFARDRDVPYIVKACNAYPKQIAEIAALNASIMALGKQLRDEIASRLVAESRLNAEVAAENKRIAELEAALKTLLAHTGICDMDDRDKDPDDIAAERIARITLADGGRDV